MPRALGVELGPEERDEPIASDCGAWRHAENRQERETASLGDLSGDRPVRIREGQAAQQLERNHHRLVAGGSAGRTPEDSQRMVPAEVGRKVTRPHSLSGEPRMRRLLLLPFALAACSAETVTDTPAVSPSAGAALSKGGVEHSVTG